MSTPDHSPLGKATVYADRYDPALLFPIPRAAKRTEIGVGMPLPFHGTDSWNAYELSWLDLRGKPQVAVAEFRIPAGTPNIIESKSFKLYLNGFAQEPLASTEALRALLQQDLTAAAGDVVEVILQPVRTAAHASADLTGESIDELPVAIDDYGPPRPTTCAPTRPQRRSRNAWSPTCCARTARSPASPTGAACRSPTAAHRSTAKACCATWSRSAPTASSTSSAWNASSWT